MADLVVRNLDRSIVEALKKRALRHGHSAEAEAPCDPEIGACADPGQDVCPSLGDNA
jgi:hypothetical protein